MEKPTELLMRCLDDFGESEATVAIVVYRQEDGTVSWRASEGCNTSEIIGLLTCVSGLLLSNWVKNVEGADGRG